MAPPISKMCGAACSRCFRRHLLQQKNTATPMMKDPATPDATDIPMIAAGVIPWSPFLFVSSDELLEICSAEDVGSAWDPEDEEAS